MDTEHPADAPERSRIPPLEDRNANKWIVRPHPNCGRHYHLSLNHIVWLDAVFESAGVYPDLHGPARFGVFFALK
jgi:hypothetical protein